MLQQCFRCALGKQSAASHTDHVVDLDHVASPVQLHDQVLINHHQTRLQMTELLACSPLFTIANTALQGLLRILLHDLLKTLHEGKGIGD